jgi:hypothetical protein
MHHRHVSLDGTPYFVRALPAGRYFAQPSLRNSRHGRATPVEFETTPGAVTRCTLTSDR